MNGIELQDREFFAAMDAVNVDLKAFTDTFYREVSASSPESI